MARTTAGKDTSTPQHAMVEKWLNDHSVDFTYEGEFPIEGIDANASRANQARFEPINEETVERYTIAMDNGDVFPPLVGYRQGTKVILIGGNHRLAAHIANNHKSVPLYLVDSKTKPAMITRLTYEDNTRHGQPASKQERLRQAQHLVETETASMTSAASALGLTTKEVETHMRRIRDAERFKRLGIEKEIAALGAGKATRIGQVQSDDAAAEVAKIAAAANLTVEEVSSLVVECNKRRSVRAAKEYLDSYVSDPAYKERVSDNAGGLGTRRTTRRTTTPLGMLKSGTGFITHVDVDKAQEQIKTLPPAELDAFINAARLSQDVLDSLLLLAQKRKREIGV